MTNPVTGTVSRIRPEAVAWRGFLLLLLVTQGLPNLCAYGIARALQVQRPMVNLDYLAASLFIGHPFAACLAFVVAATADLAVLFSQQYHFTLAQLVTSAHDLVNLNIAPAWPLILVSGCGILAIGTFEARILARSRVPARSWWIGTAGLIFGLGLADFLNATSGWSVIDRTTVPVNIAGSPALLIAREMLPGAASRAHEAIEPTESAVASTIESTEDRSVAEPAVVALVVVESLGLLQDSLAWWRLIAPLLAPDILENNRVSVGSVPFRGATTTAEFRELCGVLRGHDAAPGAPDTSCLPYHIARRGYVTYGVHGFTRTMFERNRWWPLIGLDTVFFAEDLVNAGLTARCGSIFRGACDADVGKFVETLAHKASPSQRRFIYWLTLNSHLPVEGVGLDTSSFRCQDDRVAASDRTICILMQEWRIPIESVAAIVRDATIPTLDIVLVGDHSPPFRSRRLRELFVPGRVPYVWIRRSMPLDVGTVTDRILDSSLQPGAAVPASQR